MKTLFLIIIQLIPKFHLFRLVHVLDTTMKIVLPIFAAAFILTYAGIAVYVYNYPNLDMALLCPSR